METTNVAAAAPLPPKIVETKLVDVHVSDQNVALQLLVRFLALAQKRGTFSFDESAKIYECIKCFEPEP